MSAGAIAPDEPWVPEDSFAARLVLIRHQLKLTQVEAAGQCGLDDGSWSNWERGTKPRELAQVVTQIAEALHVDRDWLMWGRDVKSRWYPGTVEQQELALKYDDEPADNVPTADDRPAAAA